MRHQDDETRLSEGGAVFDSLYEYNKRKFRWLDERQFLDAVAVVALLVLTRFRRVPEPLVIAVAGALGILIGGPSPP